MSEDERKIRRLHDPSAQGHVLESRLKESREALVGAGKQLISAGHSSLDREAVTQVAGVTEAVFQQCFETRSHFLAGLIEALLDELRGEIVAATGRFAPGMERVWQSIETYLEGNRRRPYLRALIQEGRFDPLITDMLRRRTYGYGMLINVELATLKVRNAEAAGRLLAAMAVELAVAEYAAGRTLPDLRETLYSFLKRVATRG